MTKGGFSVKSSLYVVLSSGLSWTLRLHLPNRSYLVYKLIKLSQFDFNHVTCTDETCDESPPLLQALCLYRFFIRYRRLLYFLISPSVCKCFHRDSTPFYTKFFSVFMILTLNLLHLDLLRNLLNFPKRPVHTTKFGY